MAVCQTKLSSNNFEIYYVEQTECDAIPASPVFKRIATTGGSPGSTPDVITVKELDGGRENTGARVVSKRSTYTMEAKLKYGVHDHFFEYAFQSDWVLGQTIASTAVVVDATAKTVTVTGSDITSNLEVGGTIVFPDLSGANKNPMVVTGFSFSTDTVINVSPASSDRRLTDESASSEIKTSDKTIIGTSQKRFALLVVHNDLPVSERYKLVYDCQVNSFTIDASVNSETTLQFEIFGNRSVPGIALPAGATLQDYATKQPMVSVDVMSKSWSLKWKHHTLLHLNLMVSVFLSSGLLQLFQVWITQLARAILLKLLLSLHTKKMAYHLW